MERSVETKQPSSPLGKAARPTKVKATRAAQQFKGSLARIYQGVASGLRVFGKPGRYDD